MIDIKVSGLDALKNSLNKYEKAITSVTEQLIEQSAKSIAQEAKSRCRSENVRSSIRVTSSDGKWHIETEGKISAYVEFGTGNYAQALLSTMPDDWVDMAREFYVNGLGRVPASPYLYPSYRQGKKELLENIKKNIESL